MVQSPQAPIIAKTLGPTVEATKDAMLRYQQRQRPVKLAHRERDHWKATWPLQRFATPSPHGSSHPSSGLSRAAHKDSRARLFARLLACLWNDPQFWINLDSAQLGTTEETAKYISEHYFTITKTILKKCTLKIAWKGLRVKTFDRPGPAFHALVDDKELQAQFFDLIFEQVCDLIPDRSPTIKSQIHRFKEAGLDSLFVQYLWYPEFDLRDLLRNTGLDDSDLKTLAGAVKNLAADIKNVRKGKSGFPDILRNKTLAEKIPKFQIRSLKRIDALVRMLLDDLNLPYTKAALRLQKGRPKKSKSLMSAGTSPALSGETCSKEKASGDLRHLAKIAHQLVEHRHRQPRTPTKNSGWFKE